MSTDTLRMIYYTLFHSIISYGIIAWRRAYSNSKNLLNIQKKKKKKKCGDLESNLGP